MVETKFRAKRLDNGEWVYGCLLKLIVYKLVDQWDDGGKMKDVPAYFIQKFTHEDYEIENRYEVDPKTVGQYLGIEDKTGIEIYKDDILEDSNGKKYKIVWGHDLLWLAQTRETHCSCYCPNGISKRAKIIGNTHENPERW